jgi:REP-associated tyrosine transposase
MGQSLSKLYVHLIFSTKRREPLLSAAVRPRLYAYLAAVLKNLDSPAVKIGGTRDHAHILLHLSRSHAVAETVEKIKTSSSKWLKKQSRAMSSFHWQSGYPAFSVGPANLPVAADYIARQEERHRKASFQEEYRKFLESYGVEYDEKYVWD